MIITVAWKEYREHRLVWVFMALVATILTILVTQLYPALNVSSQPSDTATYLLVVAAGSALTYGVVCGAMLLAGEREASTLTFLDALTGQRLPVWFAKLFPGVVLSLLQGLFVAALAVLTFPTDLSNPPLGIQALSPSLFFIIFPAIAVDAFIWGLLASALCSSVLTAAGLAALFWMLAWVLLLPCSAFQNSVLPLLGRAVLDIVMLCLSAAAFCQTEIAERVTPVFAPPRRFLQAPSPGSWRVLIWLPLRQGWVMIVVVSVIALFLGLFLPLAGPLMWLSCTLLIGVLFGTSAFGNEQSEGSHRFLGNQRLPMGQVWTAKVGFWLAAGVFVALAFLLAGVLSSFAFRSRMAPDPDRQATLDLFIKGDKRYIFAPLGLLYGFAIGQFYAFLWHKSIVAVVMALIVSPGFALLWLPSLIFGGLHFWQVIVPPLVLLAATRLVMWAWTSTGLALWRPALTLVSCGVIYLAWIGGSLCYRFLEVPYVSEPVNVEAYKNSLPNITDDKNPGPRLATAGREFKDRVDFLKQPEIMPAVLTGRIQSEASTFFADKLARVIEKGWPQDPELDGWLESVFAPRPVFCAGTVGLLGAPHEQGPLLAAAALISRASNRTWVQIYQEAAAFDLAVVEDSLALTPDSTTSRRCLEAGTFFEARALQLQAAGRDAEALDYLALMLDLSRHVRNHALRLPYRRGQQLEDNALRGFDRWLAQAPSKQLLERALKKLNVHEESLPSVSLSVKAEHARMRLLLESGVLFQDIRMRTNYETSNAEAELIPVMWYAPWERQRGFRMLNALTEGSLRAAECNPCEAAALLDGSNPRAPDAMERVVISWGLTLIPGESARTAHWARLLYDDTVLNRVPPMSLELRILDAFAQCRLRAARLKTALLLYESEKRKPAPDLQALVQEKYLVSVPLDPFDEQPFRYRVSQGERIEVGPTAPAEEPGFRETVKGQGIIWSVGPDSVDDGGKKQAAGNPSLGVSRWMREHLDYVFIVPTWSKKGQ